MSYPKAFESFTEDQIDITSGIKPPTTGINPPNTVNNTNQGFIPTILYKIAILYIGIIDFQPASPALVKIFHWAIIKSTIIAMNTTKNVPKIPKSVS